MLMYWEQVPLVVLEKHREASWILQCTVSTRKMKLEMITRRWRRYTASWIDRLSVGSKLLIASEPQLLVPHKETFPSSKTYLDVIGHYGWDLRCIVESVVPIHEKYQSTVHN